MDTPYDHKDVIYGSQDWDGFAVLGLLKDSLKELMKIEFSYDKKGLNQSQHIQDKIDI